MLSLAPYLDQLKRQLYLLLILCFERGILRSLIDSNNIFVLFRVLEPTRGLYKESYFINL